VILQSVIDTTSSSTAFALDSVKSYSTWSSLELQLQSILRAEEGLTVIHAGHFLLRGRKSVPDEGEPAQAEQQNLAGLTMESWDLACRLASMRDAPSIQLMTLVNDWQVPKATGRTRRTIEQRCALQAARYFERTKRLPPEHMSLLDRYGLTDRYIFKHSQSQWLFSERALRSRLVTLLDESFRTGAASTIGLERHRTQSGQPTIEMNVGSESVVISHSGHTNCAGEVVALLAETGSRGVKCFVNIYPSICEPGVSIGCALAPRLTHLSGSIVINVAVNSAATGLVEAVTTRHRFM
jgi:hypothetical protein